MPTQEERLTTLERTVALLQKRSSAEIQDLNRNVTMLLGMISGQELDIKEIKIGLVTLDEKADALDGRIERLEGTSEVHTGILNEHTNLLKSHTEILNTHTELLKQILERLPEKP